MRAWIGIVAVLGLVGCNEYGLHKEDDPHDNDDSDDTDTDSFDTGAEELCNGLDDDGDGKVDEDFYDADDDGIADCQDDSCVALEPEPHSEIDESCQGGSIDGEPPADPWNTVIEWQYSGGVVQSTPSVGDLDLDGIPEVVTTDGGGGGQLAVLYGDTGAVKWSVTGIDSLSGSALGDIDNDGYGDVVATTGGCYTAHTVVAFDKDGDPLWTTAIGTACETFPAITDLDGDGAVEVLVNEYILDGATGTVEQILPAGNFNWGAVAAADLDLDGTQEILLENSVFRPDGSVYMTCGSGGTGTFPQPVNVDGDAEGEVLVAYAYGLTLCDDDGTELWSATHSLYYGSPICVADFDDDGLQDFAMAATGTMTLYAADGDILWSTPIADYSGLAGCTSWDVDYDGVPEVVYADEQDILVMDGTTGTVVIRDPNHGSWTASETPAVADVDGDLSGELVYGSNSGYIGVTVIGSADGDWPFSPPVYNEYTYYGENINWDLSVPIEPNPPWIAEANLFRGQPSAVYLAGMPNLEAAITDVCMASCEPDGYVQIWTQVWNSGGEVVPAGALVELYGTPGDVLTLITTATTSKDLAPGESEEIGFETTTEHVGEELLVVVDGGDVINECDEDDNVGPYTHLPCPPEE